MRIAVLSRNAALYSTGRLVRSGRARGHQVDVIDPLDLQIVVHPAAGTPRTPGRGSATLCYRGAPIHRYRAVLPRIGSSVTRYGLAVVRELERGGAAVLNGADAIAIARDKVRTLALLARHRIRVPVTVAMHSPQSVEAALEMVGGCPVIIKLQHGTQGVGTMIADSRASLVSLCEALWAMGHEIVLQEYIAESRGNDIRALVIGGRVVAAMRRVAAAGEFRANLHRGATAEAVTLSPAYARCARRSAALLGLEVAGVDILETAAGPVVIEANSSPGLEGIEQATSIDIAAAIIRHAESMANAGGQGQDVPIRERTASGRGRASSRARRVGT
jgi:ribosomal protein S6--L-glutamate ligase